MRNLFLLCLIMVLLVGLSCTEERTVVRPIDTEAVHLEGVLYGWFCGVGDLWNNPPSRSARLFSSFTRESASITLIRDNGFTSWFETDDSSRFLRYVSAGSYKMVIETGYSWPPDTILNIHLTPGDTVLELDIVYDVMDPDTLTFYFFYPTIDDTLGIKHEFQTVLKLDESVIPLTIAGPLPIWRSMPMDRFNAYRSFWQPSFNDDYYVVYNFPVVREYQGYGKCWNVMQAYEALQEQLEADTTGTYSNLSFGPKGVYPCLDGSSPTP